MQTFEAILSKKEKSELFTQHVFINTEEHNTEDVSIFKCHSPLNRIFFIMEFTTEKYINREATDKFVQNLSEQKILINR